MKKRDWARIAISLCFALVPLFLVAALLMKNQPEVESLHFCKSCEKYGQKPIQFSSDPNNNKNHLVLKDLLIQGQIPNRIGFLFGTYGRTLNLSSAKLNILDSSIQNVCQFSGEDRHIFDNQVFVFSSENACSPRERAGVAEIQFEIEEQGPLALWGNGPIPKLAFESMAVPIARKIPENGQDFYFVPLGFNFKASTNLPQTIGERLAFMWDKEQPIASLALASLVSAFVILMIAANSKIPNPRQPFFFGLAAFLIASSISIFVPPFQAPDEPDHALTMAIAMKSEQLTQEFVTLAKRTHLERIKFHPEEKFLTRDMQKPADVAWGGHVSPTDLNRSAITARFWPTLSKTI